LLDEHSTAGAIPLALFALVILEIGTSFLPRPAWTMTVIVSTSYSSWDDRRAPLCQAFFHWGVGGMSHEFFARSGLKS
jgi:hypothetical protein